MIIIYKEKEVELGFSKCLYFYFIIIPARIKYYYFLLLDSEYNKEEDLIYFIKRIQELKEIKKHILNNYFSIFE